MTDFNTDYNNTELLDQELSFDQLQDINGGVFPLFFAGAAIAKLFAAGKVAAAGAIAGASKVTAAQVGAAALTGAVSGAASYGMGKALGADMDNDYGPEVALALAPITNQPINPAKCGVFNPLLGSI